MVSPILSNRVASISELKKHPMATIKSSNGEPLAILNRNEPVFYCVPARMYEAMIEKLEDLQLVELVKARACEKEIEVNINEL